MSSYTKSHPAKRIGKTPSTQARQQTIHHWDVCKISQCFLLASCSGMVYDLENLGVFGPQDSLRSDFFPAVSSRKKRFPNQLVVKLFAIIPHEILGEQRHPGNQESHSPTSSAQMAAIQSGSWMLIMMQRN